ncbi:MAG: hypothetical protein ACRDYA_07840 [Egibacteraceae bacterium]
MPTAVLALTREESTLWMISLGIGLVVVVVVIALLTFLLQLVREIDSGVSGVLNTAVGVIGNTSLIAKLGTTAGALEEIKKEALRHDALLRSKL